jgi:hypothetical protein
MVTAGQLPATHVPFAVTPILLARSAAAAIKNNVETKANRIVPPSTQICAQSLLISAPELFRGCMDFVAFLGCVKE